MESDQSATKRVQSAAWQPGCVTGDNEESLSRPVVSPAQV